MAAAKSNTLKDDSLSNLISSAGLEEKDDGFSLVRGSNPSEDETGTQSVVPPRSLPVLPSGGDKVRLRVDERYAARTRRYKKPEPKKIAMVLLGDLGKNFLTYALMAVMCALALYKVYLVQQTRVLISQYNEVRTYNEDLERQWLFLTSRKQELTEHSKIRQSAFSELEMVPPKTDAELMITIY